MHGNSGTYCSRPLEPSSRQCGSGRKKGRYCRVFLHGDWSRRNGRWSWRGLRKNPPWQLKQASSDVYGSSALAAAATVASDADSCFDVLPGVAELAEVLSWLGLGLSAVDSFVGVEALSPVEDVLLALEEQAPRHRQKAQQTTMKKATFGLQFDFMLGSLHGVLGGKISKRGCATYGYGWKMARIGACVHASGGIAACIQAFDDVSLGVENLAILIDYQSANRYKQIASRDHCVVWCGLHRHCRGPNLTVGQRLDDGIDRGADPCGTRGRQGYRLQDSHSRY